MDNPPGDAKLVDDMVFDEVDYIGGFNFSERCSFRPLKEIIGYRKDELMTFYRWRTDESYNINFSCFKWS